MSDEHDQDQGVNDARPSLQERMAAVSRGDHETAYRTEPRGSVEEAMMAGADPATGELPPKEIAPQPVIGHGTTLTPAEVEELRAPAHIEVREPLVIEPKVEPEPTRFYAQGGERAEMPQPAPEPAPAPVVQPTPKPEAKTERAADGLPAPVAATNLGYLLNSLENGKLSADVIEQLSALGVGMSEIAEMTKKKQKGSLTIKLNLETDGEGSFFITADVTVKVPKLPRGKSLAWQDENGHFSRNQPRQQVFFGTNIGLVSDAAPEMRQVGDNRTIREM